MLIDTTLLSETEQRFAERQTTREEGIRLIHTGNLLQADSPDRVQARLKRLGIDRRVVEQVAATKTGLWNEAKRGIVDSAEQVTAPGSTEQEKVGAVMAETLGIEPGVMGPAEMEVNELLLERVVGRNDLLGIAYMDRGLAASRTVGCLRIFNNGRCVGSGTGFMVSPRLLLTNNHVIEDAAMGRQARVVFNFQDDPDGNALPPITFSLDPDTFFLTSQPLDFTLIAVGRPAAEGTVALEEIGWSRLIETEGKIINGEYVTIIQHPNGQPKQIALRENQIIDVLENFLHYHTDTAPGSSGSPLFNDQWEVVGLHHSGVPKRDSRGRILTRDNTLWTAAMGEEAIHWVANEGIRISRILKHVKTQSLSGETHRLREQIFEEQPSLPRTKPLSISVVGSDGTVAADQSQSLVVEGPATTDGRATWTIPLQITVHVGESRLNQGSAQPVVTGTVAPRPSPPILSAVTAAPMDAEVTAAIEEARCAGTRPYYDKGTDSKARKKYYKGISVSLSPGKLFTTLSSLVTITHANKPPYRPGKEVYPWIDLRSNLKLRSIYSGKEFEPEELIREDFRIEQERAARLREFALQESAVTATKFQERMDFLEASLPFNCEHVVPQSWFRKMEPMRGDLHHLFACESGCNSFRGNTPYFDFPDFEEVVRNQCGKREEHKFEPGGGKGTVARATLYFLLRYPGEINQTAKEYTQDRIATLLKWHKDFPVDDYERHRNQAIYERQGNRNPLIDYPKWAAKIDFRPGLGPG
ncbi:MAG: endonuclease [Nitrospira sp.]|nr:endonuclease [Nitrospira sp.]